MLQGRYFPGMFGPMGLFPQPWLDPAFLYNEYLAPRSGLGAGPGSEAAGPGLPHSLPLQLKLPSPLGNLFRPPLDAAGAVRPLLPFGLNSPHSLLARLEQNYFHYVTIRYIYLDSVSDPF